MTSQKVSNVSFFDGKIKTTPASKENKAKAWLLYSGDQLRYVSVLSRLNKEDNPYAFHRINDSLIMLTRSNPRGFMARYDPSDTILFSKDVCVIKNASYDFSPMNQRVLVDENIQSYFFRNGLLIRKEEHNMTETYILSYLKQLSALNPITPAEIIENYSNIDSAKLALFTRFIYY